MAKTKLQPFATAAALNLERVADGLAGKRPEQRATVPSYA
jgi:hypothetical protein